MEHYARYENASKPAMYDLVTAISQSRYATGLYGWTSHLDLLIGQTDRANPYDGYHYLRISPQRTGQLEFRYIDTLVQDKQWSRIVDASDAFSRLERFLRQLHWFAETREESPQGSDLK